MGSPQRLMNVIREAVKDAQELGAQRDVLVKEVLDADHEASTLNLLLTPKLDDARKRHQDVLTRYYNAVTRKIEARKALPDALRDSEEEDVNIEEVFGHLDSLDVLSGALSRYREYEDAYTGIDGLRKLANDAVTAAALYEMSRDAESALLSEADIAVQDAHRQGVRRTPESIAAGVRAGEANARTQRLWRPARDARLAAARSALCEYWLGTKVLPARAVWAVSMSAEDPTLFQGGKHGRK
jgi:hypothetical protein